MAEATIVRTDISAHTHPSYTECACEYCNHTIRFQSKAAGHKAECPHCGRAVVLGDAGPPTLAMHESCGERIQRSSRTRLSTVTFVLGWLLFLSGFLALLSSMVTPIIGDETVARALALLFSLISTGAGLALMLEGRHNQIYWVCSACQSRLPSREALSCSACEAPLR